MQEVWKPVLGYETAYEVSSLGRVRSVDREVMNRWGTTCARKGQIRAHGVKREGYHFVNLCRKQRAKPMYVHRLVAIAFLPNPDCLPQVNHRDGDKSNNAVENLEWCSKSENCQHALSAGLYESAKGEAIGNSVFTEAQVSEIRSRWKNGEKQKHLAAEYGVLPGTIHKIVHRQRWKHVA